MRLDHVWLQVWLCIKDTRTLSYTRTLTLCFSVLEQFAFQQFVEHVFVFLSVGSSL